jgi:ribonuclease D
VGGLDALYSRHVIHQNDQLQELLPALREAEWLAMDTEADSLHAYPEKLCLIQVSIPGRDDLIDPLAQIDLNPLWDAFNQHELLMHGADYDIRLFKRGHDYTPRKIFDTMLAARLTGRTQFGLVHLVKEIVGIELEKSSQKANWARRPLTPKMEEYARNDTRHLKIVVDALREDLCKSGREQWHQQECERQIRDNAVNPPPDPDQVWRIKGTARMHSRALAVLRELWQWREGEARKRNRPPFFVLSPDTMRDVSELAAQGKAFTNILPRRMPDHRKHEIKRLISRAQELPDEALPMVHKSPPRKHISSAQKKRFEELQGRRDREAGELSIDPTLIASRATLVRLSCEADGIFDEVLPWQRALLGVS